MHRGGGKGEEHLHCTSKAGGGGLAPSYCGNKKSLLPGLSLKGTGQDFSLDTFTGKQTKNITKRNP